MDAWTNSREWNKYSTQQSASINLTAGQKYYIEVLHKEGSGGDNVAVAWQGPGISQQVIAGSYLSPFVPGTGGTLAAAKLSSNVSADEDAVSLYPNPSNTGRFTMLLSEVPENALIRIYDNQGRMRYEKKTQGNKKIEIDSQLDAGFYIITIESKKFSFTKKLVVN